MRDQLQRLLDERVKQTVAKQRTSEQNCAKMETKLECLLKRNAEIVKSKATGKIFEKSDDGDNTNVTYQVHFQYVIKQKENLYVEEELELRKASFYKGTLIKDEEINQLAIKHSDHPENLGFTLDEDSRVRFKYDRLKAVQYAERWWNDYNPAFKKFEENDCTNYVSQCLYAGGAPMRGYPNRGSGWWMRNNNWSWSWSTAQALRLYLSNSKQGLRAREVGSADQLKLGDIICYDFQGDGRYDHNTIVTGRDHYGMPLVNAHSYNSRMRYWSYEDSTAYTPNIQYKFFTIVDDQ